MISISTTLRLAALAAGLAATAADAASSPLGIWIDHTGRGAVEIAECGANLCGHVVWVKDAKNAKSCRNQILGDVKSVGSNTWDRGWIVDPDDNARYSVELKPVGEDRLRVVGYMGSKLFSETMTWKRAPVDIKRCDVKEVVVPAKAPAAPADPAPAAVAPARVGPPIQPVRPAAPAPLQREASAPTIAPIAPSAPVVGSAAAETGAAPAAEAPPEPRAQRQTSSKPKSASRECRLELPYITVFVPCDSL